MVGSNGSGKSTLLRLIAGITRPTAGMVQTSRTVGYVPERLPAQIRMTPSEYLAHMGRIRGMPASDVARRSDELLGRFEVLPSPTTGFVSLSKGNRQKVLVAQAFLSPVELLVLDEPFSALDDAAAGVLQALVEEAKRLGTAVVTSLHGVDIDRIDGSALRIDGGRLEAVRVAPATSASAAMIVELAPSSSSALSTEWIANVPGACIVSHRSIGDRFVIEVPSDRTDDLLVIAIGNGWSVRSVRSTSSGGNDGTGPR